MASGFRCWRPSILKRTCLAHVLAAFVLCLLWWADGCTHASQEEREPAVAESVNVRGPAVAGAFYPADSEQLRDVVEKYLKSARPRVPDAYRGQRPAALIVPHAGYPYSGQTAAYAYRLLEGKVKPRRVVLVGPAHYYRMSGVISVPPYTHYRTPLGDVPVDDEARSRLLKSGICQSREGAHLREHSLEVQLPFLQVIWDEPPPILPVVVGELSDQDCKRAAAALSEILDEDSLLVVSSDFTHYGARFLYTPFREARGEELLAKIKDLDMEAVRHIEALDPKGFSACVRRTGATICGARPIAIMLHLFSGSETFFGCTLHYSTSAEVTGDLTSTVSYVAFAVYRGTRAVEQGALSAEEKRILLDVARRSIQSFLREGKPLVVRLDDYPELLRQKRGVFVTLKKKGALRGCIGYIGAVRPLVQAVAEVAVKSATQDFRFRPVREEELDELGIEISVLSPFVPVSDPEGIVVGRDGLYIMKGARSGILLPQVPVEQGWDRKTFLEQTCRKAGLPPDSWKDARLYRFTAQVFNESELKEPEDL